MGEDVADLADRDDGAACARRPLQQVAVGWENREILAIRRAREVLSARADEWPGDDPTDVEGIAEAARDSAEVVETLEPESLLVGGDLEHRVGGGVADGLQRPEVLFAVICDDRRA